MSNRQQLAEHGTGLGLAIAGLSSVNPLGPTAVLGAFLSVAAPRTQG